MLSNNTNSTNRKDTLNYIIHNKSKTGNKDRCENNNSNQNNYSLKLISLINMEIKEYFILFIIIICLIWLLLIIFSPYTLICLTLLFSSIVSFIYFRIDKIRKLGLINLLPNSFRYLLLDKSILDILMDFWHLPSLLNYFKFVTAPFLYGFTPEQSLEAIQLLDENVQDMLKTKGIINLLNFKTRQLVLPSNKFNYNDNIKDQITLDAVEKEDSCKNIENNDNCVINNSKEISKRLSNTEKVSDSTNMISYDDQNIYTSISHNIINNTIKEDLYFSENQDSSNQSIKSTILNYVDAENKEKQSTSDELKIKTNEFPLIKAMSDNIHNINNNKSMNLATQPLKKDIKKNYCPELIYYNSNNSEIEYNLNECFKNTKSNAYFKSNYIKNNKYYQPSEYLLVNLPEILEKDNEVFYIDDDDVSGKKKIYKSVVITSSKKLEEERKTRSKAPYVWDNLQKYYKLKEKEAKTKAKQIFNFMELVKHQVLKNLIGKINKKAVYKSAGAFIAAFVIQFIINRGMRRYSLSALKTLIFLVTSIVTSMSVYVIANKYIVGEEENNEVDVKMEMKKREKNN